MASSGGDQQGVGIYRREIGQEIVNTFTQCSSGIIERLSLGYASFFWITEFPSVLFEVSRINNFTRIIFE